MRWTIRYEFICYLGVMVIGSLRLFRFRWAVLIVWAAITAYYIVQTTTNSMLCPGFTGKLSALLGPCLRAFSMFLAGGCHYLFADRLRYNTKGVLICLAALIPCMFHYPTSKLAFSVFGSYLLLAAAFAPSRALHGIGKSADISYGVYLYGWATQQLIINRFPLIDAFSLAIAALVVSYAAGWLSWHLVEHPFLRLKPRKTPSSAEAPIVFVQQ